MMRKLPYWMAYLLGLAVLGMVLNALPLWTGLILTAILLAVLSVGLHIELGVCLLLAALPLMGTWTVELGGLTVKPSDWIAGLTLMLLFPIAMAKRGDWCRPMPITMPLMIFLSVGLISLTWNYMMVPKNLLSGMGGNSASLRSLVQVFWAIYSLLVSLSVYWLLSNRRLLTAGVICFIVGGAFSGVYALFGGIRWTGWTEQRIIGTATEPSFYAEYLLLVIPVVLALFFRERRPHWMIALLGILGLLLVNLILTFSTGGWVALPFTIIAVIALLGKHRIPGHSTYLFSKVLVLALIGMGLLIWVQQTYAPNLFRAAGDTLVKAIDPTSNPASGTVRLNQAWVAKQILADHPMIGVGPGNYAFFRGIYTHERITGLCSVNNLYLEVLSENGLIGFLPFLMIWMLFLFRLHYMIARTRDPFLQALLVGILAATLGLMIQFTAHGNFYRIYVWALFGLGMAAARIAEEHLAITPIAKETA